LAQLVVGQAALATRENVHAVHRERQRRVLDGTRQQAHATLGTHSIEDQVHGLVLGGREALDRLGEPLHGLGHTLEKQACPRSIAVRVAVLGIELDRGTRILQGLFVLF